MLFGFLLFFRLKSFNEHFRRLAEDFVLLGWQRSEAGGGV
jgi:hypothetical protein